MNGVEEKRVPARFGVAIIGSGTIAGAHVEALLRLSDECEIKAVCDTDIAKAKALADACGLECETYTDYRDMLGRGDIDVVHVCTPPFARVGLVTDALAADKHVMCEKPFAASLEECDAMLDAAVKYGRKLAVMLQTRCDTDVRKIRRLVESGSLGPVLYATASNHHWRGDKYYRKPWRGTWKQERGGTLMNLGIHTLDAMLWILGELESVKADLASSGHRIETEDVLTALLKFRGGALGQFGCTTTYAVDGAEMRFGGVRRAVEYPLRYSALREDADGFPLPDEDAVTAMEREAAAVEPALEGFAGPIAELFAAIREDREPVTSGHRVRPTVEAATAIYKAATTGVEVRLPITRDDPWYTTEGFHRLVKKNAGGKTE